MRHQIDYYKVLQVHSDASQDVIDAAYRCLSKMYHPDLNKSHGASEKMISVNLAYEILRDVQKRREYNRDYLSTHKSQINVRPHYEEKSPKKDDPIEAAGRAMDLFFRYTVNEDWENSYSMLTSIDQSNVTKEEFIEWKKWVTKIYKLGNYKITYFKSHKNGEYSGQKFNNVLQFGISLTELQLNISRINNDNVQKYAIFEGNQWKICLGYTDLKPAIRKFKYLAHALPKVDESKFFMDAVTKIDPLTGLFSSSGFMERAEVELFRSRRYGNPLSLGVIKVEAVKADTDAFSENQTDACVSYVSQVINERIRKTDIIGRWDETALVVLFTETNVNKALKVLDMLLDLAMENEYLSYRLYLAVESLPCDNLEQTIKDTLGKASLKEDYSKEGYDEYVASVKFKETKLGKYNAADILSFNRRRKNHF
ncbi:MAG: DnaJ domain-containing protein [Eubacteriales bacterium]|nr:DnaJ domain-containing protein [Eubacteriales bacterium]MDD4390104.1 DnaJ domain-containing protein [Eubacteriales bacterium]